MITVADLRQAIADLDDDTEVVVELPGTMRPVVGVAIRSSATDGVQVVVLADL